MNTFNYVCSTITSQQRDSISIFLPTTLLIHLVSEEIETRRNRVVATLDFLQEILGFVHALLLKSFRLVFVSSLSPNATKTARTRHVSTIVPTGAATSRQSSSGNEAPATSKRSLRTLNLCRQEGGLFLPVEHQDQILVSVHRGNALSNTAAS